MYMLGAIWPLGGHLLDLLLSVNPILVEALHWRRVLLLTFPACAQLEPPPPPAPTTHTPHLTVERTRLSTTPLLRICRNAINSPTNKKSINHRAQPGPFHSRLKLKRLRSGGTGSLATSLLSSKCAHGEDALHCKYALFYNNMCLKCCTYLLFDAFFPRQ